MGANFSARGREGELDTVVQVLGFRRSNRKSLTRMLHSSQQGIPKQRPIRRDQGSTAIRYNSLHLRRGRLRLFMLGTTRVNFLSAVRIGIDHSGHLSRGCVSRGRPALFADRIVLALDFLLGFGACAKSHHFTRATFLRRAYAVVGEYCVRVRQMGRREAGMVGRQVRFDERFAFSAQRISPASAWRNCRQRDGHSTICTRALQTPPPLAKHELVTFQPFKATVSSKTDEFECSLLQNTPVPYLRTIADCPWFPILQISWAGSFFGRRARRGQLAHMHGRPRLETP